MVLYIHFEMWIVIPKRRDWFEDIAIKGRIEMHLEGIVVGCVACILLALRRYKRLDVLNTQNKPNMSYIYIYIYVAERHGTMQFSL